jgi:hypothetical protein
MQILSLSENDLLQNLSVRPELDSLTPQAKRSLLEASDLLKAGTNFTLY